jgi:hypothetical protein
MKKIVHYEIENDMVEAIYKVLGKISDTVMRLQTNERGETMKKIVHYEIENDMAEAIYKVLGKISDTDFRGTYGINEYELAKLHEFFDNYSQEEE